MGKKIAAPLLAVLLVFTALFGSVSVYAADSESSDMTAISMYDFAYESADTASVSKQESILTLTEEMMEDGEYHSVKEVAKATGYERSRLVTMMNLYQVKAPAAAHMLAAGTRYGASYKLMSFDTAIIEHKKTGTDVSGSDFKTLLARAVKTSKKSVTLRWRAVAGAREYQIYSSRCGSDRFTLATCTSGTSYTKKKLKSGVYYRFIVVAIGIIDGKQVPLSVSKNIHAVTANDTYQNVSKITVNKAKKTLNLGKAFQIRAKEVYKQPTTSTTGSSTQTVTGSINSVDNSSQKVQTVKHSDHRRLCYQSGNTKIAKVSRTGKVKAVGKGSCNIYVYAQSGLYKTVRITVR